MTAPPPVTPRRAAYQELCAIIAQLAGRSRRAQRALLEAELVRALERAYDFQLRTADLTATVRAQEDRLTHAAAQVASAKTEARQRIGALRQDVFVVIERCRTFERACRELLATTEPAPVVEPPSLVVRPGRVGEDPDPDEEAVTERCPAPSGCEEGGTP
jgi:hypothetical protein